jgi:hypothetical protein
MRATGGGPWRSSSSVHTLQCATGTGAKDLAGFSKLVPENR